jgi:hypothetical protein
MNAYEVKKNNEIFVCIKERNWRARIIRPMMLLVNYHPLKQVASFVIIAFLSMLAKVLAMIK